MTIFLLVSCGSETNIVSTNRIGYTTVFFIDKTLSIQITDTVKKQKEKDIRNIISKRFKDLNDRIIGQTIHSNTGGDNLILDQKVDFSEPDISNDGGTTAKIRLMDYEGDIKSLQAKARKAILKSILEPNRNLTSSQTDIWACLEMMSRHFKDDENEKVVVFISDMVESMKGKGRRDFHTHPLKDKKEAESFAKSDAQYIKENMKIDEQALKSTEVKILFPVDTNADSEVTNIRYYWETLFEQFGITEIKYHS